MLYWLYAVGAKKKVFNGDALNIKQKCNPVELISVLCHEDLNIPGKEFRLIHLFIRRMVDGKKLKLLQNTINNIMNYDSAKPVYTHSHAMHVNHVPLLPVNCETDTWSGTGCQAYRLRIIQVVITVNKFDLQSQAIFTPCCRVLG